MIMVNNKVIKFTVCVDEDIKEKIRAYAYYKAITQGEVVRIALKRLFKGLKRREQNE